MLCYAAQTIGYDEANAWQKRLALYASARLAALLQRRHAREAALRLDEVPTALLRTPEHPRTGRLFLTLCPGRTDRGRDLEADLATIAGHGVHHVVCLCSERELQDAGVGDYEARLQAHGLVLHHEVVADQGAPPTDADDKIARLDQVLLGRGVDVVVHCMGGLGRTGLLAAALLIRRGMGADEAIAAIRAVRSPRAVETEAQEAWLRGYAGRVGRA
ncbi:MAG: dual specificity protein phosphatase family protein [Deltaproteobacteria bacterium]|nr:dual specificity protein phosphatase family protein [Deltaproteobacteria bacterium]